MNVFTKSVLRLKRCIAFTSLLILTMVVLVAKAQPTITSISPASAKPGDVVTIVGTNFSGTIARTDVFFGNTKVTSYVSASTSTLRVNVPIGATYGPITVLDKVNNRYGTSRQFFSPIYSPTKGSFDAGDMTTSSIFSAGANPYNVAVGDIDGDGKPDAVVVNYGANTVSVLRNLSNSGNIDFATKVDFPTGLNPYSVALADIDNDTKLDIVVVNNGSSTISILKNNSTNGTVSFAAKVDRATGLSGSGSTGIAIADIDRDGWQDVVVCNGGNGKVAYLKNTSTTTAIGFATRVEYTTGSTPRGVAIGDIDGDTRLDIIVTNSAASSVSVIRNTTTIGGSLTLAAKVDYTVGTNPQNVALGDIDGDGKLDVVTSNYTSGNISTLRNTSVSGTISLAMAVNKTTTPFAETIAIADIDADGKLDVTNANNASSLAVLKNITTTTAPAYALAVTFGTGSLTYAHALGDIDGDGKIDAVVVTNYNNGIVVVRNAPVFSSNAYLSALTISAGTLSPTFRSTTTSYAASVPNTTTSITIRPTKAQDSAKLEIQLNGGTYTSIVSGVSSSALSLNLGDNTINIRVTAQDGTILIYTLTVTRLAPPTVSSISPTSGAVGTTVTITGTFFNTTPANNVVFFGATKATVTTATATSLKVTVPSGATYAPVTVLNTGSALAGASKQYFNTTYSPNKGSITKNDLTASSFFTVNISPNQVAVGDIDGDGKPDAVVVDYGSGKVSILRNTSTTATVNFAAKVDLTTTSNPYSVALADMNNDGKLDIVTADYLSATISVFRNTSTNGTVSFATRVDKSSGIALATHQYLAVADIDGDGKQDVVVANGGTNDISVLRNTSTTTTISFATFITFSTVSGPSGIAIDDINNDGKLDVVVSGETNFINGKISILKNTSTSGNISFATKADYTVDGGCSFVSIGDMNGDGFNDIITGNKSSNNVSVLVNYSDISGLFIDAARNFSIGTNGSVTSIADIDGDGKLDIAVAGNAGGGVIVLRNTTTATLSLSFAPYVVFASAPSSKGVVCADIDGDGKVDITAVSYLSSNLVVLRNAPAVSSGDNNLSSLSASAGALSPVFDSLTLNYSFNVRNSVSSTTVTATKNQDSAKIEIQLNSGGYTTFISGATSSSLALNVGLNTINFKVTAQDGGVKIYTISITRACLASPSTTYLNVCQSQLPYTINGLTFTQEGKQSLLLTGASGCDSLATYILSSVKDGILANAVVTQPTCDSSFGRISASIYEYSKVFRGTIDATDQKQTGRLNITAQPTTSCSVTPINPGLQSGDTRQRFFESYTLTNTTGATACVSVNLINYNSSNFYSVAAYNNSFNPSNPSQNYLGHLGKVIGLGNDYFYISVPANATFEIVVSAYLSGNFFGDYTLEVGGLEKPEFSINNGLNWQNSAVFSNAPIGNNILKMRTIGTQCEVQYFNNPIVLNAKTKTTSSNVMSICSSELPYTWNGLTFTAAGSKTKTGLVNSQGCDSSATLNLIVNPLPNAGVISGNSSFCFIGGSTTLTSNGDAVGVWSSSNSGRVKVTSGGKVTASIGGNYIIYYTVTNSCGIAVANFNIKVNVPSSSTLSLSACNSYTWNGTTYTKSGVYTKTGLTNVGGCDSTATLDLTIKATSASTTNASICNGNSYIFNGKRYTTAGTYTATLTNAVGCDSIAKLVLTVKATSTSTTNASICNGSSYAFNGKTYTTAGTYTAILTNAVGCDSIATLVLTVKATSASTTNASICPSSSYTFNGKTYTTAGTYTATLTNTVGCDSIATLVLTVKATSTSSTNASICPSGSYTFNGKTYTTAGTYTATLTNAVGCDSIATLVLTVKATSTSTTNASVCNGSSYTFNGKTYTTAGTYSVSLTNAVGCDSIATLVLTVKSTSTSTTNASICNGSSYTFNGKTYTSAGTYIATLTNAVGCDSIATLVLTIKATSSSTTNASICNGSSYSFNGKTYTTAGTYTATLTNAVGCDSIATLVLSVKATSTSTTNASICPSGSFIFNGKTYTTAGTYTATLTNAVGCDSIATLVLTVKATSTSTTNASICPSGSYTFNGKTYTTAGTYTATLTNAVGCDSIATLVLTVKATSTSTTNASVCNGSSYTFNGKTYTTAGTYSISLTNAVGCDSIATLVLTVKSTSTSTTNASICNGSSYTFNGKTYISAGTYTATLTNRVGCDSIATLVLTIKATSSSTTNASICNGSSYSFNGKTYTTSGTYTATLTNAVSCDSIATLVLTVKSTSASTTNASICPSGFYTFNGKTYTTAGTYIATLTNSVGCDSIATLNLTIKSSSNSTTNASICNGSSYTFNGKTYTTAGTYIATLTNSVGCDSIATLLLTAKATSASTTNASICQSSSYTFNGKTYTTAGTYTATLTNSVGCDSIATLNLTNKSSSNSTTNASICNGSSYTFNGKTYTTAGTYIATLTNSVGCDSIATLLLTAKATSASTTNASICQSSSYTFNGKTYTTAGTYTATLTNAVGCDSIATLVLAVKATSTSTTNASICQSSSYTFNGKTYTTAGTYTATLTNSVGCDSIATLVLAVKATSTSTTNASICQSSSYTFNGKSYITAGTYTATLTNSVGCDSIATLVLAVKAATKSDTVRATINQGQSYTFNGTTYNSTGIYFANLINVVGCDSTAILSLTVISHYTVTGNIVHPTGVPVKGVSINVNAVNANTVNAAGNYNLSLVPSFDYTIRPSKNNDSVKNNGVSVIDAILVQSHILNKSLLSTPYKIIAADVNNSGDVSTIDILYIKRLALGIDTTFIGNRLWTFVDSTYQFSDVTNPFPYKDSIRLNSLAANQANQSFIGMKLGDVNYDWDATVMGANAKVNKPIELYYNNINVGKEQEIRVPIRVKNFKEMLGMQYTLNFNSKALQLKSIEPTALNLDYGISQLKNGKIAFLWNDAQLQPQTLPDGSVLFELVFTKLNSTFNEEDIVLSSDISAIEAWDASYQKHGIIKTLGRINNTPEFASNENWQVSPNPTSGEVKVDLSLSSNKSIRFQLTTLDGKVVYQKELEAVSGNSSNKLNLTKQTKLAVGIYFLKAIGVDGVNVKQIEIK